MYPLPSLLEEQQGEMSNYLKWLEDPHTARSFDNHPFHQANLLRSSTEAREARGLPPLPMSE